MEPIVSPNPMVAAAGGSGLGTPPTASRSAGSAGGSGAANAEPPSSRSDTAAPTPQAAASPRSSSNKVHLKVKLRVPDHSSPEVVLKAFRETLEKGNVGGWKVHVDHDATQATIECSKESAKAVKKVLEEHLKAEHLDAAVEEQSSVTMYPRVTVYKLSAIDSAAQAWEGEVVVELLFVVNIEARVNVEKTEAAAAARSSSAAKKEEVATSASPAAPAAAEVAAAGTGPDEVVEVLVAAAKKEELVANDRWEVYPKSMQRGGGALLGDLHLPENKELNKTIERLFAYKVANYESDSTKSDSREKWAKLHRYRRLKGEDPERFWLQSVFSIFERLNGRFSQRFKLKSFPLDTQKLRIEVEAGRAELLSFWKPTHQETHEPDWLENLLKEEHALDDKKMAAFDEKKMEAFDEIKKRKDEFDEIRKRKEAAFLWPWLEIAPTAVDSVKSAKDGAAGQGDKSAAFLWPWCTKQPAKAAEKAKPTRGSFIVVKDKAMPVYA